MGLALAVVTVVTACSAPSPARDIPVAPYVYLGSRVPDLAAVTRATSADSYVLSFLLARDGGCDPVWPRGRPLADPELSAVLRDLRAVGGSVAVASGGARGAYLERACATAGRLAEAYRAALAVTGADRIDIDVERKIPAALVAEALSRTRSSTGAEVTVTAEVLGPRRGLAPTATALLRELARREVEVTVNAMLMNFSFEGDRRAALVEGAETVAAQVQRLFGLEDRERAFARTGVTYMVGRDDTGAVTTLADAVALRSFAARHRIGFLGFWSLNRDNGGCAGRVATVAHCSGIAQDDYAFTRSLIAGSAAGPHRAGGTGT
ncbi:glycoside hydrolase family 18 protein [Saccharomonospora saliphila]|uniref:hypothetical protein n=1 Tax=Saccharomonospora saliphila TaxID=369829 RepID=UPI000370C0AC|nr:hypothetical protein [Saccharomonospora saliphila]